MSEKFHVRRVINLGLLVAVVASFQPIQARAENSPEEASQLAVDLPAVPDNPFEFGAYLIEVADLGETSEANGDHISALQYYAALARAVPNRAVSYRKMCGSYEALGDRKNALAACRTALGSEGAEVRDYVNFVRVVRMTSEPLSDADLEDVNAAIDHLENELSEPTVANRLGCEIAVKQQDEARLETCVSALSERDASDPTAMTFEWSLAMLRRDSEGARGVLARARDSGMPAEAIATMERGTRSLGHDANLPTSHGNLPSFAQWTTLAVGVVSLLAVLFFLRRRVGASSA